MNKGVNPLNVLEIRRVDYCPSYFESITLQPSYNLAGALDEWIQTHLSGRYYIGNSLDLSSSMNTSYVTKVKIAFENPSEMSYFMLACPLLKY